jgi:hypothetical protein
MSPRTRILALAALALALALALVWGSGRQTRILRFAPTDLQVFDLAELEIETAGGARAEPLRAPAAAAVDQLRLALRGRVRAAGRPLAGAEVRLELQADGGRAGRLVELRRPAATDASGEFRIEGGAPRARRALLTVRHPDFAPCLHDLDLAGAGAAVDVGTIELRAGGALTGVLVGADGSPAGDATVALRPGRGNALRRAGRWAGLLGERGADEHGVFRFDHLPAGAYELEALAPTSRAETRIVEVEDGLVTDLGPIGLQAGFEVRGRILDPEDRPLAGAEVRVQDLPGVREMPRVRAVVRSAEDGTFAVRHLPRRRLRVEAGRAGFVTRSADLVAGEAGPLDLRLERGMSLTGTVVEAGSGRALTRYAVAVRPAEPGPDGGGGSSDALLPDDLGPPGEHPGGTFRFEGLDRGLWCVLVRVPEFGAARSEPVQLEPGREAPPLTLQVAATPTLVGAVVVAADGRPLAGVALRLTAAGDGPVIRALPDPDARPAAVLAQASTAADGSFRIPLPADTRGAVLRAEHPGFSPAEVEVGGARHGLRIELAEPARLSGRVLGAGPGTQALAYGGPDALHLCRVGPDGSYRFDALRPGTYLLRAFDGDPRDVLVGELRTACDPAGRPLRADLSLGGGEIRTVDLEVRPIGHGQVVGTVLEDGAPLPDAQASLRIERADQGPRWVGRLLTAAIGPDGRFAIDGVPPGTYLLVVERRSPERAEVARRAITVEPVRPTEVRIEFTTRGR